MKIPQIGLGTWQLTGEECVRAVRKALDLGYRHIDTAALYGNHREIGVAIRGYDRSKIFITSKVWNTDLSYEDTLAACDLALQELDTDYIDLYLIHWPNPAMPMEPTFKALLQLKKEGKIREFGVSNFNVKRLGDALRITDQIRVNQVEFHPFLYQKELLEFCKKNNVQLIAYSPLARGHVNHDATIKQIAMKHKKTPGQISLRWILDKGAVAIPKASSEKHLRENLELDFKLDAEDMQRLDHLPQERLVAPGFGEF